MKALAVALLLACGTAAAEPPADAPRMSRVDGGYLLNDAGYAKLERETTRLQIAEAQLTAENRELRRTVTEVQSAPRLNTAVVVALVSTSLAIGVLAGWKLKELKR